MNITPLLNPEEFPAAGTLAKLLTQHNDKKLTNKVGSIWMSFDTDLRELSIVKSNRLKRKLAWFLHSEIKTNILNFFYQEPEIYSFFCNVINARYKMFLRGDNSRRIDRQKIKYQWKAEP